MYDDKLPALDELVGEEIRHLRLGLNISQTALGEQLGVTYHQVQKYETGQTQLTIRRLVQIAKVLNVEPAHFLRGLTPSREKVVPLHRPKLCAGPSSTESLDLADKIARIRDDPARREILASIERLVSVIERSQESGPDTDQT